MYGCARGREILREITRAYICVCKRKRDRERESGTERETANARACDRKF